MLLRHLNFFLHSLHVKGFSPVCVLKCSIMLSLRLKFFLHSSHVKGFLPVCILKCRVRWPLRLNFFVHSLHVKGFSPEFLFILIARPQNRCVCVGPGDLYIQGFLQMDSSRRSKKKKITMGYIYIIAQVTTYRLMLSLKKPICKKLLCQLRLLQAHYIAP